jgi:hypothetical protein
MSQPIADVTLSRIIFNLPQTQWWNKEGYERFRQLEFAALQR